MTHITDKQRREVAARLRKGSVAALWSVAVGNLPLAPWKLNKVVKRLQELDGFEGVHILPRGTLLFFESENAAKVGRNEIEAMGNGVGRNICRWVVAADGVPEFDTEWAKAHGMGEREDA